VEEPVTRLLILTTSALPKLLVILVPVFALIALGIPGQFAAQTQHPETTRKSAPSLSSGPDCSGGWPTNMAFVLMKNAGITDNNEIDFSKTKTVRIASERVDKDLWRQVYDVTFTERSGGKIEAIAVHEASREECSMTGVELYVVSRHLSSD
jgi:hypothetical protein